jgi:hypothetical protein
MSLRQSAHLHPPERADCVRALRGTDYEDGDGETESMKVWVVLGRDYEDVFVDSVWTSESAATARAERLNAIPAKRGASQHYRYEVTIEMETDAPDE